MRIENPAPKLELLPNKLQRAVGCLWADPVIERICFPSIGEGFAHGNKDDQQHT